MRRTRPTGGSRCARCWSDRRYPSSTTPTSSRARRAHTTPGRAQSAASRQHGSARQMEQRAHPRAARAPEPQERARHPHLRRLRDMPARRKRPHRQQAVPLRRRHPRRATPPSPVPSAEAGSRLPEAFSRASSPSCSSRSSSDRSYRRFSGSGTPRTRSGPWRGFRPTSPTRWSRRPYAARRSTGTPPGAPSRRSSASPARERP